MYNIAGHVTPRAADIVRYAEAEHARRTALADRDAALALAERLSASNDALRSEVGARDADIAQLRAQVAELGAQLATERGKRAACEWELGRMQSKATVLHAERAQHATQVAAAWTDASA